MKKRRPATWLVELLLDLLGLAFVAILIVMVVSCDPMQGQRSPPPPFPIDNG